LSGYKEELVLNLLSDVNKGGNYESIIKRLDIGDWELETG